MLTLRPYQQTAVHNILADWRDYRRVLLMAATGTGKTIMFLAAISETLRQNPASRAMIIAHRRELIYQPVERATQFLPGLAFRMGVVMAERNDVASQVIVATVQSLANRVDQVLDHGPIDYVVVDECHHATSDSYTSVLEALGNPYVLGCTATPKRSDNQALGDVFEKVSYRISIQDAIRQGALVPFTPLGFVLPADVSRLKETRDGWEDEPLGELLSSSNVLEIVHAKWREFSANRQTIAFTASVAQAYATADYFTEQGVLAAALDGTTAKTERDRILRSYQAGEIQVVFNCMVLTEGFDAPETGCVMMVAPTRSDLVYVQRLGRGLRTAPGKDDCMVLDFAPTGARDVVMAGDVLEGVPRQVRNAQERAEEAGVELLEGFTVDESGNVSAIDPHEIQTVVLDYLSRHRLAWSFDGAMATAALSENAMVAIIPPEHERLATADEFRRDGNWNGKYARLADWIGSYRLYRIDKVEVSGEHFTWAANCIGSWSSMAKAKANAEEMSKQYEDSTLAGRRKTWRQRPMSEKQANYLRRLGAFAPGLTSGQAAQRITHTLARRAVSRVEKMTQKRIIREGVAA